MFKETKVHWMDYFGDVVPVVSVAIVPLPTPIALFAEGTMAGTTISTILLISNN